MCPREGLPLLSAMLGIGKQIGSGERGLEEDVLLDVEPRRQIPCE